MFLLVKLKWKNHTSGRGVGVQLVIFIDQAGFGCGYPPAHVNGLANAAEESGNGRYRTNVIDVQFNRRVANSGRQS